MYTRDREDVREVAIKLEELFQHSPVNYYYVKCLIQYISQKDKKTKKTSYHNM